MAHTWGYGADNGPHTWAKTCDNAAGAHQSPINIDTKRAVFDDALTTAPLTLNLGTCTSATLLNTGHGFQVKLNTTAEVSNGPLNSTYKFLQFHMHWGRDNHWGSEHLTDGQACAAELHMVFWNAKYPTPADAVTHCDGLTVLGVHMEVGEENAELQTLVNRFPAISYQGAEVDNLPPVQLDRLLPRNKQEYFTYPGSLTTPPCNECVTWIVFKEHLSMSAQQLTECRTLHENTHKDDNDECSTYGDTFRPPCPLGKRVLRKSFP